MDQAREKRMARLAADAVSAHLREHHHDLSAEDAGLLQEFIGHVNKVAHGPDMLVEKMPVEEEELVKDDQD